MHRAALILSSVTVIAPIACDSSTTAPLAGA